MPRLLVWKDLGKHNRVGLRLQEGPASRALHCHRLQSRQPWRGASSQQPQPRSTRARWVSSCSGQPFPTLSLYSS